MKTGVTVSFFVPAKGVEETHLETGCCLTLNWFGGKCVSQTSLMTLTNFLQQ